MGGCGKIGFKYADLVGTHWCRHTFIRLSDDAGRNIKVVQQNTGDTVETLLKWYREPTPMKIRKDLEEKPLVK